MALDVKQHVIQTTVKRFEESLQHMYNLGFEEGKKSVQKTGHWIYRKDYAYCSVCKLVNQREEEHDSVDFKKYNYCPWCGAIMKGSEKDARD